MVLKRIYDIVYLQVLCQEVLSFIDRKFGQTHDNCEGLCDTGMHPIS